MTRIDDPTTNMRVGKYHVCEVPDHELGVWVLVLDDYVLACGVHLVCVEVVLDVEPEQIAVRDHQLTVITVLCDVFDLERSFL